MWKNMTKHKPGIGNSPMSFQAKDGDGLAVGNVISNEAVAKTAKTQNDIRVVWIVRSKYSNYIFPLLYFLPEKSRLQRDETQQQLAGN